LDDPSGLGGVDLALVREIQLLELLGRAEKTGDQNVVELVDVTTKADKPVIVMELLNASLKELLSS
jgi:ribosomal protein S12 methylthiotransferase accessory factor YcaO